jgi:FkbM family methyltransferase
MNKFVNKGTVHMKGVSDTAGVLYVSDAGCDGQKYIGTGNSPVPQQAGSASVAVPLVTLPSMFDEDQKILILKVDTEGNEYRVLKGALNMFKEHRILNAFVEVTTCCNFWSRIGITKEQVVEIFGTIASYGYGMIALGESEVVGKYRNQKPQAFMTPESIMEYIGQGTHSQQDMWLFLKDESTALNVIW